MAQKLLVFQSMWAMIRRHSDGKERTLDENLGMIVEAGFDGVSYFHINVEEVLKIGAFLRAHKLTSEATCFPSTVDALKPVLEVATKVGVHHVNIQPNLKPRRIDDCVPILEGWQRLAEEVDFPVYIETHRDRMTTDLFFTLDLLDRMPGLKLTADLSHYLVGREFAFPVTEENHKLIHQIIDSSWAFHGRVASREQVQIEISFTVHKKWLDLFLGWWEYGFRSWRRRAGANDTLAFTCELGPQPYAIIDREGNDTTDRWAESLQMRELVRGLWTAVGSEPTTNDGKSAL